MSEGLTPEEIMKVIREQARRMRGRNVDPGRVVVGADAAYALMGADQFVSSGSYGNVLPPGCIGRVFGLWVYQVGVEVSGDSWLVRVEEGVDPPNPREMGRDERTFWAMSTIKEVWEREDPEGRTVYAVVASESVLEGLLRSTLYEPVANPPDGGTVGFLKLYGGRIPVSRMDRREHRVGEFRVAVLAEEKMQEDPVWTDV